jgi:hypothetical protein
MNLNDRALLVQLNISQWTARKYDKRATEDVAAMHNAGKAAGRFNKALLPMNDYLDNVQKKATLIRTRYYQNTLPWAMDGTQMLPSANYLAFMTDFRKQKSEWEYAVSMFVDHYEDMKIIAKRVLGSLYSDADYPSENEIIHKFKMDMAVFPVPSTDFRVQLSNDELNHIRGDLEARLASAQQTAVREVWDRLFEKVKHIADKLADPSAIFRDSLVENAREMCALLPRLNFTDDPNLEAMRAEVEAKLIGHHPDALRNNLDLRQDTAAEAADIMKRMSVFMSGI